MSNKNKNNIPSVYILIKNNPDMLILNNKQKILHNFYFPNSIIQILHLKPVGLLSVGAAFLIDWHCPGHIPFTVFHQKKFATRFVVPIKSRLNKARQARQKASKIERLQCNC